LGVLRGEEEMACKIKKKEVGLVFIIKISGRTKKLYRRRKSKVWINFLNPIYACIIL